MSLFHFLNMIVVAFVIFLPALLIGKISTYFRNFILFLGVIRGKILRQFTNPINWYLYLFISHLFSFFLNGNFTFRVHHEILLILYHISSPLLLCFFLLSLPWPSFSSSFLFNLSDFPLCLKRFPEHYALGVAAVAATSLSLFFLSCIGLKGVLLFLKGHLVGHLVLRWRFICAHLKKIFRIHFFMCKIFNFFKKKIFYH